MSYISKTKNSQSKKTTPKGVKKVTPKLGCDDCGNKRKGIGYKVGGDTNVNVSCGSGKAGKCKDKCVPELRLFSGNTTGTFQHWDFIEEGRRAGTFYKLALEFFGRVGRFEGDGLKFFSSPYGTIQLDIGLPGDLMRDGKGVSRVHAATTYAVSDDRILMGNVFCIPVQPGNLCGSFVQLANGNVDLTTVTKIGYVAGFAYGPLEITAALAGVGNNGPFDPPSFVAIAAGNDAVAAINVSLTAGDVEVVIYFCDDSDVNADQDLQYTTFDGETDFETTIGQLSLMVNGALTPEDRECICNEWNSGFRAAVRDGRYDAILDEAGVAVEPRWTPATFPQ